MSQQPQKISNGMLWIIVISAFIAIGYALIKLNPSPDVAESPSPSIAASPSPIPQKIEAKCVKAGGRFWVGVELYRSSSCTQKFAYVFGGNSEKVFVALEDGSTTWLDRSEAAWNLYVKDSDPAIAKQEWMEMKE
ncbi:MAG TPA: hypothetical protein V6C65_36630 [Allocoleopsis sp.]